MTTCPKVFFEFLEPTQVINNCGMCTSEQRGLVQTVIHVLKRRQSIEWYQGARTSATQIAHSIPWTE
eukprot:m.484444 g.484444  ORF g.484444 m.484444 type:complete len:67 (-) comp68840_c0_seq1:272-472(-)